LSRKDEKNILGYNMDGMEKVRLLVLEDEAEVMELLKVSFEQENFEVVTADDAESAFVCISEKSPGIIICDAEMKNMNGLDFRDAVRREPSMEKIPFIFICNRTHSFDIIEGLDLDVDDYTFKPFDPREIVARAKSMLCRFDNYCKLINFDKLTGLYNRSAIEKKLAEDIKRSIRYGREISVVIFEIDDFSETPSDWKNEILKSVADIMLAEIREVDYAGRFDKMRFIVVMPETDKERCLLAAERIRNTVKNFRFPENVPQITISGGLANIIKDNKISEVMLEGAKNALIYAKDSGGNKITVFEG